MKTREELIENARRDIADAERCQALHITPATGTILRRLREVTNALAVFEAAHTPTDDFPHGHPEIDPIDDEREGAAERIIGQHLSRLSKRDGWAEDDTAIGGQAANIVRQLSEAGLLRRSEVPEPSNTERIARSIAELSSWQFGQAMALVQAVEALTPSEVAQSLSPEPQGEPCDLAAHFEVVAYADDIAEGGDPVPEDYEHHYCDWDGEDWPCARIRSVQGEPSKGQINAAALELYGVSATYDVKRVAAALRAAWDAR